MYVYVSAHTHTHTYIHTQWNITQSLKKNEILPFAANVGGSGEYKRSKLEQFKYYIISLICRI